MCKLPFSSDWFLTSKHTHTHIVQYTVKQRKVLKISIRYFVGPRFKFQPSTSILRAFVIFLGPSRQMLEQCLKIVHDRFLSHPFYALQHEDI